MTPDGNIQFNGEPADYFFLNPMPVIILSSNTFIQYRNQAAVKWIDSKPEASVKPPSKYSANGSERP